MLDVGPIHVPPGECEVSFEGLASIIRIPYDQPTNHIHLVAMEAIDCPDGGIPLIPVVCSRAVLGSGTQELQIPFQNVFNPKENIAEARLVHEGCKCLPMVRDGRGHGLDKVIQLIQSGVDDRVA